MNKVSTCAKEFETFCNLDGPDLPNYTATIKVGHIFISELLSNTEKWQEPGAQLHVVDVENTNELRRCCLLPMPYC